MELGLAVDLGVGSESLPRRLDLAAGLLGEAERLGYTSVWIGETYPTKTSGMHLPGSLLALAALASRTTLRLGTGVLLFPAWHPLKLAYETALLDQISGGRLMLGFGIGRPHFQTRFDKDPKQIGRLADETLEALRSLWGGADGYTGELFSITGGIVPLPVQDGGPPILVGGSVRRSAERAARYGAGYHASTSYGLSHIKMQIGHVMAAWDRLRPTDSAPLIHANRLTVVAETEDEATALGRHWAGAILDQYNRGGSLDRLRLPAMSPGQTFDRLRDEFCIVGTPDSVRAQIEQYANAGVTQLDLRVLPGGMPIEHALTTISLLAGTAFAGTGAAIT